MKVRELGVSVPSKIRPRILDGLYSTGHIRGAKLDFLVCAFDVVPVVRP